MHVLVGPRAHLHDLVVLAINTGLRENELFSLKPDQVDFHRDVINVRETKGGEDRYVPMNDVARQLLYRLLTSAKHNSRVHLFTNPKTKKKYTTIKTAWLTACRLAEIEDLNFHDLRHTFGTRIAARIAESGVDPPEVIGTLASHMRADITDFFDGEYLPELIGIAAQRGLGHLIKRIKIRRWVEGKGDDAKQVEEIDFEIARDNLAAVQLSKILRLEQIPQFSINLSIDDQRQINFLVNLTKKSHAQAQAEGDPVTIEGVLDEILKWEKEYQNKDLESLKPIVMKKLTDGSFGTSQDSQSLVADAVTPERTGDDRAEQRLKSNSTLC